MNLDTLGQLKKRAEAKDIRKQGMTENDQRRYNRELLEMMVLASVTNSIKGQRIHLLSHIQKTEGSMTL